MEGVTPDTLTFERDTWDIPQTVTVQSLTDEEELNDIVTITHMVSNYGPVMEADEVESTVAEFELSQLAQLAPLDLTATTGNGAITLQWKSPVSNQDGRIPTSYQYRYTPTIVDDYASPLSSGAGWITIRGGSTARFVQFTGLINLAEYTFQVRAVDAALLVEADSDTDLSTMIEVRETYEHRTRGC